MLKTIVASTREIIGLFIDDGSLAASLLIWIALVAIAAPRLSLPSGWGAPLLHLGCLAILAENVLRGARRASADRPD
jgi:hypothetical protein